MHEDLEELRFNGLSDEADGVVNSGDEGDFGNEGTIVFNEDVERISPQENEEEGYFSDGIYAVLMRLSKCSIEFEFSLDGDLMLINLRKLVFL